MIRGLTGQPVTGTGDKTLAINFMIMRVDELGNSFKCRKLGFFCGFM